MGCDCARTTDPSGIFNAFWAGCKIREKDKDDLINMIKAKKGRSKQIQETKFKQFVDNLLENENYHEESAKLFQEALKESRKIDEGYFFLSCLFLAKPTPEDQENVQKFVDKFVNVWKGNVQIKDSLIEAKGDQKASVKTQNLKELLNFYVKMVSQLGVQFVASQADNKELFVDYFSVPFSDEKIQKFVDERFLEKYKADQTELEAFFTENLKHLQDDLWIRNELITS